MGRFSTAEQRLNAQETLVTGAWRSLPIGVATAWHLRQVDSKRASEIACALLLAMGPLQDGEPDIDSNDFASIPGRGVDHLCSRAYLLLVIAEDRYLHGRTDEAAASAEQASAMMRAASFGPGLSDALWLQASLFSVQGAYAERDAHMKEALAQASAAGDAERRDSCQLALWCFDAFEDAVGAFAAHGAKVDAFLSSNDAGVRCLAKVFLAECETFKGNAQRALQLTLESQRDAEACGQYRRAILEACSVGAKLTELSDADGALNHLQEALQFARKCDWPLMVAALMVPIVHAMLSLERYGSALEMAQEAESELSLWNGSKQHLTALHALGLAEVKCNDLDNARKHFERIILAADGDAIEMRLYALIGLASVELAQGASNKGALAAASALDLARQRHDAAASVDAVLILVRCKRLAVERGEAQAIQAGPEMERLLLQAMDLHTSEGRQGVQDNQLGLDAPDGADDKLKQHSDNPDLVHQLANAVEIQGRVDEALHLYKRELQLQSSKRATDAARRSIAMEVRHRTERALRQLEHQRQIAEVQRCRAVELEALNEQLRGAMSALQQAQALLQRRNDELAAAYEQISELSVTDPLTGLKNRRFLALAIDTAVAETLRSYDPTVIGDGDVGSPQDLLFFMLDLDFFKRVNDEHGHAAGDAVLVQLRDRLRSVTREGDYLVRWGGEEFLVAARGLNRNDASVLAERLRLAVSSVPFDLPSGQRLPMTVSIGFSGFPLDPLNPGKGTWNDAVELADERLYAAKRGGRNQWVGSGKPMHPIAGS